MIERSGKEIVFVCDGERCNEICETDETEFNEALAKFKREGWKVFKVANDWLHLCPACAEDRRR